MLSPHTSACFVFLGLRATQSCRIGFRNISRYLHHGTACERQLSMPRPGQGNVARYDWISQGIVSLTGRLLVCVRAIRTADRDTKPLPQQRC
jgi:hypothetical protein